MCPQMGARLDSAQLSSAQFGVGLACPGHGYDYDYGYGYGMPGMTFDYHAASARLCQRAFHKSTTALTSMLGSTFVSCMA